MSNYLPPLKESLFFSIFYPVNSVRSSLFMINLSVLYFPIYSFRISNLRKTIHSSTPVVIIIPRLKETVYTFCLTSSIDTCLILTGTLVIPGTTTSFVVLSTFGVPMLLIHFSDTSNIY